MITLNATQIRTIDQTEEARATSTQILAFSADPVMRWMWPEPHQYLSHFPALVRGFGGRAFENGTAHVTSDFRGGTLWLPPGVSPDGDALDKLFHETLTEPVRSAVVSILEQMDESHPHEPHWHLAFIGVDPAHQGKGTGAALLRHTLAQVDERGLHAYLESSNPANIPLYQRHGFEVIREIRVGDSPPVTPMRRVPSRGT
jgi:ribosomal protein S18 acetylase RimI-like enzyme